MLRVRTEVHLAAREAFYLIPWARDLSIFLLRWNGESIPEIFAHVFIGRAPQSPDRYRVHRQSLRLTERQRGARIRVRTPLLPGLFLKVISAELSSSSGRSGSPARSQRKSPIPPESA